MVAFGHTAVGAAVGFLTYQAVGTSYPGIGLILSGGFAAAAHYITDLIPHGHFIKQRNFKSQIIWVLIFDLFLSSILFTWLAFMKEGFSVKFLYILFGMGGSHIPDVLDGLIYIGVLKRIGFLRIEHNFHLALHWHGANDKALMFGIRDVWQIIVALLCASLLIWG